MFHIVRLVAWGVSEGDTSGTWINSGYFWQPSHSSRPASNDTFFKALPASFYTCASSVARSAAFSPLERVWHVVLSCDSPCTSVFSCSTYLLLCSATSCKTPQGIDRHVLTCAVHTAGLNFAKKRKGKWYSVSIQQAPPKIVSRFVFCEQLRTFHPIPQVGNMG